MRRDLTNAERSVILRFAESLNSERANQLEGDVATAQVEDIAGDGSRLMFVLEGYERPEYEGQHLFGPEGKANDRDGTELTILLHADANDRLFELEIIKWKTEPLIRPDWSSLEVFG